MAGKTGHEVEKEYTAAGFASRLRRCADAIEQGKRFTIQIKGLRVSVPADAEFSIEHEREGSEEEIEFGIKWTRT